MDCLGSNPPHRVSPISVLQMTDSAARRFSIFDDSSGVPSVKHAVNVFRLWQLVYHVMHTTNLTAVNAERREPCPTSMLKVVLRTAMLLFCLCIGLPAFANTVAPDSKASDAACTACAATTPGPTILDSADASERVLWLCAVLMIVGCGTVVTLVAQSRADTRARRWRLSDALSEDVSYTDDSGRTVTLLTASSSRLIAMLGLIVILSLYVGMGLLALHAFALGKATPSVVDTMLKFLAGGGALFVPYLANQARAAFEKKVVGSAPAIGSGTDDPLTPTKPSMPALPAGPKV